MSALKTQKRQIFTGFHWLTNFSHAQDDRAASWEPRPDPIATKPQHKRSRLNGSRKYLATWGDLLQKKHFLRVVEYFIFSAYSEKEGGDVVADQHLHRLHHRQLPHCEDHSKRLGDCPQVRSQRSQLWAASPKIMRLPLKIFYALGKIIFEPLDKKHYESLAAKVHWLMIDSELVICCSPHHAEYRESLMILMKDA